MREPPQLTEKKYPLTTPPTRRISKWRIYEPLVRPTPGTLKRKRFSHIFMKFFLKNTEHSQIYLNFMNMWETQIWKNIEYLHSTNCEYNIPYSTYYDEYNIRMTGIRKSNMDSNMFINEYKSQIRILNTNLKSKNKYPIWISNTNMKFPTTNTNLRYEYYKFKSYIQIITNIRIHVKDSLKYWIFNSLHSSTFLSL